MTGERWKQVRDLFDAVLDQPADQRNRYLSAHTAGDPGLAQEVRDLLASFQESDHMLTQPAIKGLEALLPGAADAVTTPSGQLEQTATTTTTSRIRPASTPPRSTAVTKIGPYRLLGTISLDATGSLLLGSRDDQRVKVKVFRTGMQPVPIRPRGLDHPHLARLLDDGVGAEGLSYLVIENVQGLPIDQYCDERRLDAAARLRLFADVCRAVQHAHQNLAVHGQLEAAHILVTSGGAPNIFGFGLSRPTDATTTAADLRALGQLLRRLFPAESVVPAELAALIAKSLSDEGNRCYMSADALARDVDAYLEPGPRTQRSWWRHPAAAALAGAWVLTLIAAALAGKYFRN